MNTFIFVNISLKNAKWKNTSCVLGKPTISESRLTTLYEFFISKFENC
jgi:hypothetical protein